MSKELLHPWMFFFNEDFTFQLSTLNHPFTVAVRLRDIKHKYQAHDIIAEHTGEPKGDIQSNENANNLPLPDNKNPVFEPLPSHNMGEKLIENDCSKKITTFVANMSRLSNDSLSFPEYLYVAHKLNQIKIYEGLDKLKTRVDLRDDMQVKDYFISWSPIASSRLLKYFVVHAAQNT